MESQRPRVELTDLAAEQIRLAMEDEERKDLALRISIERVGGSFRYTMDLVAPDERQEGEISLDGPGFSLFVRAETTDWLDGVTIDFVHRLQEAGFKFNNPNSAWSNPVAASVQELLDREINPQIASHGGVVTLIDVKDGAAYISMGGGCQGCGMADVTLRQGIEATILDKVPEITRVLDTTDHGAGTNPYFAGS